MASLPGCMMPDGAEPCEAFKELQNQVVYLKQNNKEVFAAVESRVVELEEAIRDFAKYLPPEVNARARAVLEK